MSRLKSSEPEFVNMTTAARMIGVGASSVRGWVLIGWLPATREGWQWRIRVADLMEANAKSLAGAGAKQRGKRGKFYRRAADAPADAAEGADGRLAPA